MEKLRGNLKKKNSIFTDIIQIDIAPPPSYPIFDKLFFDNMLIMLTSLPPLKFLTILCLSRPENDIIYNQILHLHAVLESLCLGKV